MLQTTTRVMNAPNSTNASWDIASLASMRAWICRHGTVWLVRGVHPLPLSRATAQLVLQVRLLRGGQGPQARGRVPAALGR